MFSNVACVALLNERDWRERGAFSSVCMGWHPRSGMVDGVVAAHSSLETVLVAQSLLGLVRYAMLVVRVE
jgi:hypothetical protein